MFEKSWAGRERKFVDLWRPEKYEMYEEENGKTDSGRSGQEQVEWEWAMGIGIGNGERDA